MKYRVFIATIKSKVEIFAFFAWQIRQLG